MQMNIKVSKKQEVYFQHLTTLERKNKGENMDSQHLGHRQGNKKYYVVTRGRRIGVFDNGSKANASIRGFPKGQLHVCDTLEEAEGRFELASVMKQTSDVAKYYGVSTGRKPGVYTTSAEAKKQTLGFPFGKFKSFYTLKEAEEFSRPKANPVDFSAALPQATHSRACVRANCPKFDYSGGRERLVIYTDGACSNNQNSTKARAGMGVYFSRYSSDNYSGPLLGTPQTNQRAELGAILKALQIIGKRTFRSDYLIRTDSQYAINAITSKWKAVENIDIIKPIQDVLRDWQLQYNKDILLEHVKAHDGNSTGNQMADNLARQGIPDPPKENGGDVLYVWGEHGADEYPLPLYLKDKGYSKEALRKKSIRSTHANEQEEWCMSISAACVDNVATFGVWFGPNNPDNYSGFLMGDIQTKERAELAAVLMAMFLASRRSFKIKYRILYSSKYLEEVMADWIFHPLTRDFLDSDGKPVKNGDLIKPVRRTQRELMMFGNLITASSVSAGEAYIAKAYSLAELSLPRYHKDMFDCRYD